MYKILKKKKLAEQIWLMDVEAPRVAAKCLPGEFLIVKIDRYGERIPLTICDYDREKGTVLIVFQVVGASSYRMAELNEGDFFEDVVGPLGCPSELTKKTPEELRKMNILFVAGGVGTAPVYPQVKWLKEQGVTADVVQGAKNKDLVILEDEMRAVFEELVEKEGKRYDLCVAIGPMIMMKFVALLTKKLGIPTVASMNPIMVDGTGMCGACRLIVGDEVKFACVDGPEFDAHKIDFDQAMKRARMYASEEGREYLRAKEGKTHHGGCGNCGGQQ